MKIVLRQDYEPLGTAGEIVNVKTGFARNFLIPKGYALTATPKNIQRFKNEKEQLSWKIEKEKSEDFVKKLSNRLWGDNFFDAKNKKWLKAESKGSIRSFCHFILNPIRKIIDLAMADQIDDIEKALNGFGMKLTSDDKKLKQRTLMKRVMQKWLPAHLALTEMIILELPSPEKAQSYRVDTLYEGPLDDIVANSIRTCDPTGPLTVYISKMIPSSDKGRFIAFGRVFSAQPLLVKTRKKSRGRQTRRQRPRKKMRRRRRKE